MANKKITPKTPTPKKGKYDIAVKTDLTADELFKLAATTPIKKSKVKKEK